MQEFDESRAVKSYLRLMHEIVVRLDLVAQACTGELNLSPPYAFEYCYLQYRRICELLALGCLQLHGDLQAAQTNSASKEWNAEKIMSLLHRSHPHAFPQCATKTMADGIWKISANCKPNAMTLSDFKTLYNKCGQVLHRGTIRSIESEKPFDKMDYNLLMQWSHKLVDLLNQHIIGRANGIELYFTSLKTESGGPACSVFSGFSNGSVSVRTYNLNILGSDIPAGKVDETAA